METSRSPGEGDDGQLLAVEGDKEADGVASLAEYSSPFRLILSLTGKGPDRRMDEGTDLDLALILTENLENSNFSVHRT